MERSWPENAAAGAPSRSRLFWMIAIAVLVVDAVTKYIAVERLSTFGMPHEVLGDALRMSLVYNPGAAFGLHLGEHSRWIFIVLTFGALAILWRLFRETSDGDTVRIAALGLVSGGAVGNFVDRIRSPLGVVDFIDVGFGWMRWPTFNVADMAVSTGAVLLAMVLWK
jgi:signal peptidase II